jgi:transcriptional repressor NrdR
MRCPFCRIDNDKVVDSRASDDGYSIRRRRLCMHCRRRYTTRERLDESVLRVVKKDGLREPFDPEKIRRGLFLACYKRPIANEQIEALVLAVENEVHAKFDAEAPSRRIGEIVMEKLRDLDHVAFVRFASVYREFKDAQDFVHEVEPILRGK